MKPPTKSEDVPEISIQGVEVKVDFPLASKGRESTDDLLTKVGRRGRRIEKAELW